VKRTLIASVVACLAVACGKEAGPVAGDLDVTATATPTAARAVLLRVVGTVTGAAAPAGSPYRVFATTTGDTTRIAVIAPAGVVISTGPVVTLTVPDTRRASAYTVTAVQASSPSYQLITPSFTFTVATP
jgi:hypothetical protein